MFMFDLILINGIVVNPRGRYKADIGIENGQITSLTSDQPANNAEMVLDLADKFILPGCIDSHMHLWEPGFVADHDFRSSTLSSAAGGVTTIIEHPLSPPEMLTVKRMKEKIALGQSSSYVDFGLHAGVHPDYLSELPNLWEAGCTAFKIFMCFSGTEVPGLSSGELAEALKVIGSFGGTAIIHAENDDMLDFNLEKIKANRRTDNLAFVDWRSPQVEIEAINRALYLLEGTGARAVILHTTVPEGVSMVNEAKHQGLDVWVETCPHILYLTHNDLIEKGSWVTFSPPLRDKRRVDKLWSQLRNGEIQLVGSDHGPVASELKNGGNVLKDQPGLPGAETLVPLMLNAAAEGWITLEQLTAILSENPAKLYGLFPTKGTIRIGSDADFTIVDLNQSSTIHASHMKTLCGWTPYEGRAIRGRVTHSILRGKIIMQEGEILVEPGCGRFISRRL
jgi:allantoinase